MECKVLMIFCIDYKAEWYVTARSVSSKGTPHIVLEHLFKIMLITLKSYFCIRMKEKQSVCLKKHKFHQLHSCYIFASDTTVMRNSI